MKPLPTTFSPFSIPAAFKHLAEKIALRAALLLAAFALGANARDYVQYVNVLQGTDSSHDVSNGNTLPMVARPFAMTDWTIQTREDRWFFDPKQKVIQGIRATHQPSPWMGDYGYFNVIASAGDLPPMGNDVSSKNRQSFFEALKLSPNEMSVTLKPSDVRIQMTPTGRSALFRFTFPAGKPGRVMLEALADSSIELDRNGFKGFTRSNSGGVPENYAFYFSATFDKPIKAATIAERGHLIEAKPKAEGLNMGAAIDFAPSDDGKELVVEMRIGTSFIGADQAALNAGTELGDRDFETVSREGRDIWNKALGKIDIEATPRETRTFYSCFYRAQLFPREFHEYDADGKPIHYSPFNGKIEPGVLYTDNGFWDTYRTFYSFLAIVDPERFSEIMQGWMNVLREGGWFAQWPSPGYRACMIGSHSDAVVAEAVVKNIPGFDYREAFEGMLKHADTIVPGDDGFGRPGLKGYLERGYVYDGEAHASASAALDYAYDDFCIAQVARTLGENEIAEKFEKRALNYRNNFDKETNFTRGRTREGGFTEPFDEFFWGGPYVEGGPWQSTWSVQHDPAGLIALMGGPAKFVAKLDQMFATPGTYHTGKGGYENVIHEMVEMARLPFGQYAHSNQTVHHVLYLYAAAGYPWKTQYWVRRVLDEAYSPEAFAGDEDNGEMSAWYLLGSLGIYPLCPGRPEYVIGSPLVRAATVQLPDGKQLRINAAGNSPATPFVTALHANGKPWDKLWISYADLMAGATLDFTMSDQPNIPAGPWEAGQLPPSLSEHGDLSIDPEQAPVKDPAFR